ncbi:MAG: TonB-dependent receptor [Bacteroidales bacterium]|nr:TonB-dependent receptor [Bacteroidales bacterium]
MMKNHLRMAIAALLIFMGGSLAFAQNKVSGTVKDAAGEPIVAASVVVRGTTIGVVTDLDGNYTISVPANSTLVASCIGYSDAEVRYSNQSTVNFVLKEDALFLDETVVIGYQTVKRRDLTGSVASVNSKQLSSAPVANVAQALQGKLPGVNIVSQDGRPDATVNIRVRGGGSISQSNDPLILIDGVAGTLSDIPSDQIETIDVLKDASSTAIYGARGANGVILITTKGAKEGKVRVSYGGYAKLNTPTKYLDALDPYDYLSYVWANANANDGMAYGQFTAPFEQLYGIGQYGDIERYRNTQKYDVQKQIYGPSFSHSHDLSISGGTDLTKVLFSVNYNDEDGMKVNSYSKRANVSLKVNQKISDRLNVGLDLRYTDVTALGYEGTGSRSGSTLSSAYRFRPIATGDILGDLNAFNGGAIQQYGKASLWDSYDPYKQIMDYEPLRQRQSIRGTISLNWNIVKGLTYHTDLFLGRSYSQNKTWSGALRNNYIDDATGEKLYAGSASLSKSDSWNLRWTNTLNYELEIGKAHRLNFLIGHELSNSGGNSINVSADYFPSNYTKENAFARINQFDATATQMKVTDHFSSGWNTASRILSFFGRINYTLLDRYLFTATFRADGSSKFAPSHRWGYFPAGAFAWRVSEEPFMEEAKWLNDLKLRLSYGTVGNDGISSDLWSQTWEGSSTAAIINGQSYLSYDLGGAMANPDLKWETTITRNLGIDFGVLNGRLSGTIDLYWNTTKDLLMQTTLPGITGFTSTYANIGQTSNKGIEISLNAILVQTRDWGLTFGGNINFNRNNIDALADGVTGIYGSGWFSSGNPGNDYILQVGSPVGLVRGLTYDGWYTTDDFTFDPATNQFSLKPGVPDLSASISGPFHGAEKYVSGCNAYPGMAKFKDTDKDGVVDASDYTVIGHMYPKATGGFNLTANYKNWDLGAYFNFSIGNQVYNITKIASLNGYKETGVYENHLSLLKDAYKIFDIQGGQLKRLYTPAELDAANANAKYPCFFNENYIVSDLGIEDGSYLRLNTLTLGYTVPSASKFAKALSISSLRVYATVYNLFTITKYSGLDPEVSSNEFINNATYPTPGIDWGSYPRARSFVIGVNVSF